MINITDATANMRYRVAIGWMQAMRCSRWDLSGCAVQRISDATAFPRLAVSVPLPVDVDGAYFQIKDGSHKISTRTALLSAQTYQRLTYDEHRQLSARQHPLRLASKQEFFESLTSVRGHHDQIRF